MIARDQNWSDPVSFSNPQLQILTLTQFLKITITWKSYQYTADHRNFNYCRNDIENKCSKDKIEASGSAIDGFRERSGLSV